MKIYFETYGCTMNQGDTESMNSCGVIEYAERKIARRIEELKDKKIIVAGCLPRINFRAVEKAELANSTE